MSFGYNTLGFGAYPSRGGVVITATGGTITVAGDYVYHTFTSSGTFSVSELEDGATLDALIVAGGGGGGSLAGGGGAGGGIEYNDFEPDVADYTITIGAGAVKSAAGTYNPAYNGNNTTAFSQTAIGGGRGAGGTHVGPYIYNNNSGGSGGGGFTWDYQKYDHSGAAGTSGQGNAGGNAGSGTGGAGGGGKGAVGTDADGTGGDGGVGINWKSLGTYYAGGGGGSHYSGTNKGAGGNGGGGDGNAGGVSANAQGISGSANTGGGGGGGFGYGVNGGAGGGAGGSGIVIIRYLA